MLFRLIYLVLQNLFEQFHRALLAGIIGAQFAAEGFGEDGFLHGVDLLMTEATASLACCSFLKEHV